MVSSWPLPVSYTATSLVLLVDDGQQGAVTVDGNRDGGGVRIVGAEVDGVDDRVLLRLEHGDGAGWPAPPTYSLLLSGLNAALIGRLPNPPVTSPPVMRVALLADDEKT